MSDIAIRPDSWAANPIPGQFNTAQAKLDGLIAYAQKTKDWPLLEAAIDAKIEDQRTFVDWWDDNVRSAGNPISQDHGKLPMRDAERDSAISNQQVSRWRKELTAPERYRDKVILAAYRKAGMEPEENHRAEGTGDNEWFTPPEYIAAAREVMGGIDLDPATHAEAQKIVQAERIHTRQDSGLAHEWHGRVWLNPPYAPPLIGQFVGKLVQEVAAGRVQQAILLTHNYTDTAWFHEAATHAALLCFTRGRIRFTDIDGSPCSPTQGQCFFYFGCDRRPQFNDIFGAFGFVR
jgi:phage N-6-adenine-methyltransferase